MKELPPVGSIVIFNKHNEKNYRWFDSFPDGDIEVEILAHVGRNRNVAAFIIRDWQKRSGNESYIGTALPEMFSSLEESEHIRDKNAPIIYHYRTRNMTRGGFTAYLKDGCIGVAKCSMDDVFCRKIGRGMAKEDWCNLIEYGKSYIYVPSKEEVFRFLFPYQKELWDRYVTERNIMFIKK